MKTFKGKVSEWVREGVKGALRPSNAKKLYMDEKSTEKREIIEKDNRKVKGEKKSIEKEENVLLLCLTSILQPVWLGWP